MGEDQHPSGPRGLDEPEGGHGLAGAGGVLEPEAPVGVGVVLQRTGVRLLVGLALLPVDGLLVGGQLVRLLVLLLLVFVLILVEVVLRVGVLVLGLGAGGRLGTAAADPLPELEVREPADAGSARPFDPFDPVGADPFREELWSSERRAISVPERASTWCGESSVPSTRCGSSWLIRRSSPSISEY
ncbi:MAG: hypothetical protein WKF31_09420 [Thermoleophilaceae bacterium]